MWSAYTGFAESKANIIPLAISDRSLFEWLPSYWGVVGSKPRSMFIGRINSDQSINVRWLGHLEFWTSRMIACIEQSIWGLTIFWHLPIKGTAQTVIFPMGIDRGAAYSHIMYVMFCCGIKMHAYIDDCLVWACQSEQAAIQCCSHSLPPVVMENKGEKSELLPVQSSNI